MTLCKGHSSFPLHTVTLLILPARAASWHQAVTTTTEGMCAPVAQNSHTKVTAPFSLESAIATEHACMPVVGTPFGASAKAADS